MTNIIDIPVLLEHGSQVVKGVVLGYHVTTGAKDAGEPMGCRRSVRARKPNMSVSGPEWVSP
jgi:hypothetical protein